MRDPVREETEFRSANDLLHARLQGRISRREMIHRASSIGLALPVVGILLQATGDNRAFAAETPIPATKRSKPDGETKRGETLNVGVVGVIDSLNPYLTSLFGPSFDILAGVMEGLLSFDSNQQLQPALAESYGISDDGLVYTFNLREGVKFHNGDAFTSEDVLKTWEMLVNEDFPARQRLGWEKIQSIETPNARTAIVTTSEIYAPFLSNMSAGAFNNAVISPKSLLEKGPGRFIRDSADPVGTGAFQFVERRGNQIVLESFTGYWGGKPNLAQIIVTVYETYAAQLEGLLVGEVDLIAHTGVPGDSKMRDVLEIEGINVYEYPGLTWGHLDLKQVDLLRDSRVRQALDYATPRKRIVDEVLLGEAIPAVSDQSPGSWVFDDELNARSFKPERSAELLDDAGIKLNDDGWREYNGELFRIELWGEASDPQAPGILNEIAASWTEIGVVATVKFEKRDILWGPTGYQFTDRMTAGYYRWSNVNDPDNMFYWHSSQIPTSPGGPGGNIPAFFNEYSFQDQIDDLTSRAAAETDVDTRKALYVEIQALLLKEVPVIFLFWDKNFSAAAAKIGGFWPSVFNYLLWNAGDWYMVE